MCIRDRNKGDVLSIQLPQEEAPLEIVPQNLPLQILYEDDCMIVLNKAAGMVVHPAAGNWDGTVVNALAHYLQQESPYGAGDFGSLREDDEVDGESRRFRPGIVHRLDKVGLLVLSVYLCTRQVCMMTGYSYYLPAFLHLHQGTTGVLVVAKTSQALAQLSQAFADRTVKKTYLAITVGNPGKLVTIDKPIARHPVHRQRMRVVPDPHRSTNRRNNVAIAKPAAPGRRAISHVHTLAFDSKLSLAQVRIDTGRTHQIRVHLQDRHTPVYGDEVYGIADWNQRLKRTHGIERPLLHAFQLELEHPVTNESMVFTAPMAEDMRGIAKSIWPLGVEERPELFFANE